MTPWWKSNHALFLILVGALAWLIPGAGHFTLNEKRRGIVIFVAVALTFLAGLYVGSIGVVDPVNAKPWYAAQLMNSPAVLFLGDHVADAYRAAQRASEPAQAYLVYGRANEIGQIYTSIAGLLNLLCIVNAVYMAHLQSLKEAGA
jgi:TM2 domain-containing membrane protein YozV